MCGSLSHLSGTDRKKKHHTAYDSKEKDPGLNETVASDEYPL